MIGVELLSWVRYPLSVSSSLPQRDHELVQIIDLALADATQRAGAWLVCRPGCTKCCIGVFAINQLDAARLRDGLVSLESSDPQRAFRIRERASQAVNRLAATFPGDPLTGILGESPEEEERFADFANHEPCPVLDPQAGTCNLYTSRPLICRTFGPPIRTEDDDTLGVCELCFDGAGEEEISACEMPVDPDNLESTLVRELQEAAGVTGETIVAFALGL